MELIPLSEQVTKLSAVCMVCFRDAAFSKRLGTETAVQVHRRPHERPVCAHMIPGHWWRRQVRGRVPELLLQERLSSSEARQQSGSNRCRHSGASLH
jgi:hypothetical protein